MFTIFTPHTKHYIEQCLLTDDSIMQITGLCSRLCNLNSSHSSAHSVLDNTNTAKIHPMAFWIWADLSCTAPRILTISATVPVDHLLLGPIHHTQCTALTLKTILY